MAAHTAACPELPGRAGRLGRRRVRGPDACRVASAPWRVGVRPPRSPPSVARRRTSAKWPGRGLRVKKGAAESGGEGPAQRWVDRNRAIRSAVRRGAGRPSGAGPAVRAGMSSSVGFRADASQDQAFSTHRRPAAPIAARPGERRIRATASATSRTTRPSTTLPHSPSSTASGAPPELPADHRQSAGRRFQEDDAESFRLQTGPAGAARHREDVGRGVVPRGLRVGESPRRRPRSRSGGRWRSRVSCAPPGTTPTTWDGTPAQKATPGHPPSRTRAISPPAPSGTTGRMPTWRRHVGRCSRTRSIPSGVRHATGHGAGAPVAGHEATDPLRDFPRLDVAAPRRSLEPDPVGGFHGSARSSP